MMMSVDRNENMDEITRAIHARFWSTDYRHGIHPPATMRAAILLRRFLTPTQAMQLVTGGHITHISPRTGVRYDIWPVFDPVYAAIPPDRINAMSPLRFFRHSYWSGCVHPAVHREALPAADMFLTRLMWVRGNEDYFIKETCWTALQPDQVVW